MPSPSKLMQPANDLIAVTQSDATADPNGPFRQILISVAGAVKVTTRGGSVATIPSGGLSPGFLHDLRVQRVWVTGTTATGIFGVPEEP